MMSDKAADATAAQEASACAASASTRESIPEYLRYVDARKVDSFGAGVIFAFLLTRRGLGFDPKRRCCVFLPSACISPEALSLLSCLVAYRHEDRPTAAEALKFPYFA
jgi:hypothetical protein